MMSGAEVRGRHGPLPGYDSSTGGGRDGLDPLQGLYADLHVHIGQAMGRAIKITASRDLTLENLLNRTASRKGLDIIGVVDAASPRVLQEVREMLAGGELAEVAGGGLLSESGVLLVLGAEVETREGAHFITYLPDMTSMQEFSKFLAPRVTNPNLSTQKAGLQVGELVQVSRALGGIFCPAHAFTPHKGAYGCWVSRLADGLGSAVTEVEVLELGLSADSCMAGMIAETDRFNFLSNSDAHSLQNVAREYNWLAMRERSFAELHLALAGKRGRSILANYGMDPRLGKYHRTYCPDCRTIASGEPPVLACEHCGNPRVVMGVLDRVCHIADYAIPRQVAERAPYYYRVPLNMLPGLGNKLLDRLVAHFGSEIEVMEKAGITEIARIAGENIAVGIDKMRNNQLSILPGGGGKYGKIKKN